VIPSQRCLLIRTKCTIGTDRTNRPGPSVKNVQIIDGADNALFLIYPVTNAEFDLLFPNGSDIDFADLADRRVHFVEKKLSRVDERAFPNRRRRPGRTRG
jgi:hypothetical protein